MVTHHIILYTVLTVWVLNAVGLANPLGGILAKK